MQSSSWEYLNPSPKGKTRRRRVTSSPDPTDSDLSAFLDGFEHDLCPVVSNGVRTQVFPTVDDSPSTTLVEESCKPTKLQIEGVFDQSMILAMKKWWMELIKPADDVWCWC